jgi:hypothetical protein
MKVINVRIDDAEYVLKDDRFVCAHVNVDVEPPCCNGNNCDCRGLDSVYCEDCKNEDLTEDQVQEILVANYED